MDDPMPSPEERNEAISILSRWDVARPSVDLIDDYASRGCYGVDIPERLLWEAFVMRADTIERGPEGSRYESDRNSEPSFQDMNFGATRGWKGTGPRPVVWQHDTKEPLCPQSLLVAYEEEGRVLPVVSDFDCFLIGTRGVSYDAPLPPDQVEYLQYYVSHIERILDGPDASHSWSTRWFNVLKDAGCKKANKVMLGYGFGDPKSNSIFENAVERLKGCGAVRHGAECFNYYFPQELELDEKFLVISDRLPGNPNVPWTYMNETELRHFLTQKIDQGYTFPLNPKWVLCDPGWKALYDKFAASERYKVKQSFDAWYPPDSGLREKIEEISARHPGGFQRRAFDGRVSCPREMEILSTLPSLKRACGSNFTTERRSEPLIIPLALSELRSQDRTQSVPVKPTVMPEILTSNKRSSHHRPLPELEMVGTEKMDLKLLELERHRVIQRAKRKLRMAIIWINFAKEMKSKTQGKLMRDDAKTIGPTRGLTARDEVESSLAPTSLSAEFFTSGESTLAVSGNDDSADDVQSSAVLTNLPAWLKVTQTKAALHHDFGLKSVVETEPDALPMTLATKPPPPPPPVSRGGSLARGGRRREWTNIGSGSIKLA
uniref:Uncharacterized protein n=1 Tax=Odontella aurita TaxID=265563 RepID=A0A7S4N4W1_9STRA